MQEMTMPSTSSFDAASYKDATRKQWQEAAEAWHRWGPAIEDWLGAATEAMLDLARIGPGDRVLDVAAGAGGQTLAAARRVGDGGSVLATDISSNLLELAEQEARRAGLANVTTRVLDGERLDVDEGSFDAVISRVGFIYFPNQQDALRGMHRALKSGGRLAGIVYSTPQNNEFFSIPVGVIRRRAQLPAPAPGQPGPFSFGQEGVIEAAFEQAGFQHVEARRLAAPLRLSSAAECVRFERESFGALHQMLAGLDEPARDAAWQEIEQKLGSFEGPEGFAGPCEMIVAAGTKP
jgi:ubiquinone/menaquinone biosynthesis C-methylase UbiE